MTNVYTTCGYQGHICSKSGVQFISRYRDQNDYCVAGQRIAVYDSGLVRSTCHSVTLEEIAALEAHFLAARAEYEQWHAEQAIRYGADWPAIQPWEPAQLLRM